MRRDAARTRIAVGALSLLCLILPFEPRHPSLRILGLEFTLLELLAAAALAALVIGGGPALRALLRRPPLPVVLVALFAAVHVLSAALAPFHRELAARFALRMVAAALFAFGVAASAREAHRKGLLALGTASAVVALLALGEGAGLRALDPVLGLFRETPFYVAGTRRASAGSEYPNLAAAFLMYGLVAGVGLPVARSLAGILAWTALLAPGLLLTYSRGAIAAAVAGLVVLIVTRGRRDRRGAARPAAALAALAGSAALLASAESAFVLRLAGEDVETWYRARCEPDESALALSPGEVRSLRVRVANVGRRDWTRDDAVLLGYHWYDRDAGSDLGDGFAVHLGQGLPTGGSLTLEARVEAPARPGRYQLLWDVHHVHLGWLSGHGGAAAPVAVSVSEGVDAPAPAPLQGRPSVADRAWRPSRSELWRLALAMWGERPWIGVGPDNFRRLYGAYAGKRSWDTRIFANNTALEVAATTGALGLLAFVGVVASTAWAALTRFRRAPPGSDEGALASTLLALTFAMAVHGTTDYVLAFTGHYLFQAFLVGASASPGEDACRPPGLLR